MRENELPQHHLTAHTIALTASPAARRSIMPLVIVVNGVEENINNIRIKERPKNKENETKRNEKNKK